MSADWAIACSLVHWLGDRWMDRLIDCFSWKVEPKCLVTTVPARPLPLHNINITASSMNAFSDRRFVRRSLNLFLMLFKSVLMKKNNLQAFIICFVFLSLRLNRYKIFLVDFGFFFSEKLFICSFHSSMMLMLLMMMIFVCHVFDWITTTVPLMYRTKQNSKWRQDKERKSN